MLRQAGNVSSEVSEFSEVGQIGVFLFILHGFYLGTETTGVTLGAGIPLSGNSNHPVLLLGLETQISNSAKLLSENWFFTGDEGITILSGGIRFFGDRLAVDLAFLTNAEFWDEGGFPLIPYVGFSVFWGK